METDAAKLGDKTEETIFQMVDLLGAGSEIAQAPNPDWVGRMMEGKAAFRQLGSRHVEERSAIVNRVLGNITNNDHSPETQALADKITPDSRRRPAKSSASVDVANELE